MILVVAIGGVQESDTSERDVLKRRECPESEGVVSGRVCVAR